MGKTITIEIPEAEAERVQKEIEELLRQTNAILERVQRDQNETQAVERRTRANLEYLKNFKLRP